MVKYVWYHIRKLPEFILMKTIIKKFSILFHVIVIPYNKKYVSWVSSSSNISDSLWFSHCLRFTEAGDLHH